MTKKGQKQKVAVKELVEKDTKVSADEVEEEEEVNSGFGSYLRSSAGKNRLFKLKFVQLMLKILFRFQDKRR
jgi:hypothetical protein